MTNVRALIDKLAAQEALLRETRFIAPCVAQSRVRVWVARLLYTFRPTPPDFEGWGIFRVRDMHTADLVGTASLAQSDAYLKLFPRLHVRLATHIRGRIWSAYATNESDARQHTNRITLAAVYLVDGARQFDQIVVRLDGPLCWFEHIDTRADPRPAEHLRRALHDRVPPADLQLSGLTPAMAAAYALAVRRAPEFAAYRRQQDVRARLRAALALGGGTLDDYTEHNDYYQLDWHTPDGEPHTSAVAKRDLTVLSAGICLSDRDADFDLQSLVGVVERQWE